MFVFILSLLSASFASASVLAPVENLFIPSGFDHNDFAEVIVEGYLPSPCYQRPEIQVTKNGMSIDIQVTTQEKSGSQFVCPTIIVPFLESVHLGTLAAGTYNIGVNQGSGPSVRSFRSGLRGTLQVTTSTSNQTDDFIYALVDYVERDFQNQKYFLNGHNYSDCLELDQVQFVHNGSNTISVKPIMRKVSNHCPRKMVPFRYEISPPFGPSPADKILLHVRSANGKAVNSLVDFTL